MMLKLQKPKTSKYNVEKYDFNFSNLQAVNVPVGYDKLVVSIVSLESGKTIARTNKAIVRSGICQWHDIHTVSVKFLRDAFTRDLEDRLFKFVLSMGSARTSILGEATVNLVEHLDSKSPIAVSLALKKWSEGTVLQVKVQCLNPSLVYRESDQWKETASEHDEQYSTSDDLDTRSEGSDHMLAGSVGPGNNSGTGLYHMKDGVASPTTSHGNTNLADLSSPRASGNGHFRSNFSHMESSNGFSKRQDFSMSNRTNSPRESLKSSSMSPFSSKTIGSLLKHWQERSIHDPRGDSNRIIHSGGLEKSTDPHKSIFESADIPIEELRQEAMTWESIARRLRTDVETVKHQLSELSKENSDIKMECSATIAERDSLKEKVEHLSSVLLASTDKGTSLDKAKFEAVDAKRSVRELQEEVELQKQFNANLNTQLKKTQASNAEFISAMKEIEETVEKKNTEISKLQEELGAEKESRKHLKSELRKTHDSQKQLLPLVNELKEKVKEQKAEIEYYNNIKIELTDKLEAAKEECKSTRLHVNQLRGKTEELQKRLEETEYKLSASTTDGDSYKAKARVLQSRMDSMLKEIAESARNEYGSKVEELTLQLSASKLKEEDMNASLENTHKLLENMKSSESAFRERINDLENTIRAVNAENEKLKEDLSSLVYNESELKELRRQLVVVQGNFENVKIEKNKLQSVLQSKDHDIIQILSEKMSLLGQLEHIEAAVLEGDGIKHSKAALKEKILLLQEKLGAQDESLNVDAGQKREAELFKKFIDKLGAKLQDLQEMGELKRKIRTLERELQSKAMELSEAKRSNLLMSGRPGPPHDSVERPAHLHMKGADQSLKKEIENLKKVNKRLQTELSLLHKNLEPSELLGKVVTLEIELAEATEANSMYRSQLQSFMFQDQSVMLAAIQRYGTVEQVLDEVMNYKQTVPTLESDLKDIRERYFRMTLQYAEVEAHCEELTMTVKNLEKGRKWF